jgi:sterol desaturase/sphingolipid hydroxylase (fatty acid hydroxylase superfamily)
MILVARNRRQRGRKLKLKTMMRALFPRRITRHVSTGVDISYLVFNTFIFGFIFGWSLLTLHTVSNGVLTALTWTFGAPTPSNFAEFVTRALVTFTLFLAYELGYWCHHYLCHRVPFLWEFHKVHHTANVLTPLTAFRTHPVDTWLFANMLALAVGGANGAINYALGGSIAPYMVTDTNVILVIFIHVYVHFQHTHLWIAFQGLLGRIFLSPAHHQVHHSNNPVHFNTNLGSCLAVWDWLFGTLYVPGKTREHLTFGVEPNGRDPQTISEAYLLNSFWIKRRKERARLRKTIRVRLSKPSAPASLLQSSPHLQGTAPQDSQRHIAAEA